MNFILFNYLSKTNFINHSSFIYDYYLFQINFKLFIVLFKVINIYIYCKYIYLIELTFFIYFNNYFYLN